MGNEIENNMKRKMVKNNVDYAQRQKEELLHRKFIELPKFLLMHMTKKNWNLIYTYIIIFILDYKKLN